MTDVQNTRPISERERALVEALREIANNEYAQENPILAARAALAAYGDGK